MNQFIFNLILNYSFAIQIIVLNQQLMLLLKYPSRHKISLTHSFPVSSKINRFEIASLFTVDYIVYEINFEQII